VRVCIEQQYQLKPKTKTTDVGLSLPSLIPKQNVDDLRAALEWLGLANPTGNMQTASATANTMPPLPKGKHTPLDLFAYLLSQKLRYAPGERDMVVLAHEVITRSKPNGHDNDGASERREVHTSTLITKATTTHNVGYPGERPASAMARTVGMPIAIAALLVSGTTPCPLPSSSSSSSTSFNPADIGLGVQIPTKPALYKPILHALREVGKIEMVEKTRVLAMRSNMNSKIGRSPDEEMTVEDALVIATKNQESKTQGIRSLHPFINPEMGVRSRGGGGGGGSGGSYELDLDADRAWRDEQSKL